MIVENAFILTLFVGGGLIWTGVYLAKLHYVKSFISFMEELDREKVVDVQLITEYLEKKRNK